MHTSICICTFTCNRTECMFFCTDDGRRRGRNTSTESANASELASRYSGTITYLPNSTICVYFSEHARSRPRGARHTAEVMIIVSCQQRIIVFYGDAFRHARRIFTRACQWSDNIIKINVRPTATHADDGIDVVRFDPIEM